ncbi:MAG: SDR family oxidoreductase [Luteolibacter sp.]
MKNYLKKIGSLLSIALLAFTFVFSGAAQAEEENKMTVLITGANRGLGFEYAKAFAAAGDTVIGTARSPEEATELKSIGAEVIKLDVTSDEDIANMAKTLKGRKIDVLINNAGYLSRETTRKEMNLSFEVNTMGPLYVSEALIPNLSLSDSPKIVNISSRAGRLEDNPAKMGAYNISKAALNMVTLNLHGRLAKKGFIVVSLAPGLNRTDMIGNKGGKDPADSAAEIIPLIKSFTQKHAGGFWYFDGSELDW